MATYIIVSIIAYLLGSISFSGNIQQKISWIWCKRKGKWKCRYNQCTKNSWQKSCSFNTFMWLFERCICSFSCFYSRKIVKDTDSSLLVQLAGIFVVLGHTFPVFFKFKGGKGVATSLGVLLITNWQIGLICLVFALILMSLTRFVSLGSIAAAILFPVLTVFIHENYLVPGIM